jgi:hypothetical protein
MATTIKPSAGLAGAVEVHIDGKLDSFFLHGDVTYCFFNDHKGVTQIVFKSGAGFLDYKDLLPATVFQALAEAKRTEQADWISYTQKKAQVERGATQSA